MLLGVLLFAHTNGLIIGLDKSSTLAISLTRPVSGLFRRLWQCRGQVFDMCLARLQVSHHVSFSDGKQYSSVNFDSKESNDQAISEEKAVRTRYNTQTVWCQTGCGGASVSESRRFQR